MTSLKIGSRFGILKLFAVLAVLLVAAGSAKAQSVTFNDNYPTVSGVAGDWDIVADFDYTIPRGWTLVEIDMVWQDVNDSSQGGQCDADTINKIAISDVNTEPDSTLPLSGHTYRVQLWMTLMDNQNPPQPHVITTANVQVTIPNP